MSLKKCHQEYQLFGSLKSITAISPSRHLYTTDLGLINSHESFMWFLEIGKQVWVPRLELPNQSPSRATTTE